jgi:hypothetical protein
MSVMRTLGDEAARVAAKLARSLRIREFRERRKRLGMQDVTEIVWIDTPANGNDAGDLLRRSPADGHKTQQASSGGGGPTRAAIPE